MKLHQLSAEAALASLRSKADGLSKEEAAHRLVEFGPNTIAEVPQRSWLLRLLQEYSQFFSLVLWVAAMLSFLMEWLTPNQGMVRLGIAIVAVILISGVFAFWQEYRAEHSLAALRRLLPQSVTVLRQGEAVELAAEALVPGDVLLLEAGARIPADCRLIEAFGVCVNNATVTGEAVPQARSAATSLAEDAAQADNILLAGTDMVSGRARALVVATAARTVFGTIAHLTQRASDEVSPLRREVARLSRTIVQLAVAIGLVFFVVGHWAGVPGWQNLLFATGIIVAMVPEGLLPTLTLALVLATQRMAQRQVLIRHLPAVEALGSTTVICTDKTGTLTQNRMAVKSLLLGMDERLELVDPAAALPGALSAYRPLLLVAGLCHDLVPGCLPGRPWQGDPMELALEALARRVLGPLPLQPKLDELPFDAERMRLTTLHGGEDGPVLYSKGAPEVMLPRCSRVLTRAGVAELTEAGRHAVLAAQEEMTRRGLRVLALAYRPMTTGEQGMVEEELVLAGLAGLEDPPRPEVAAAIGLCRAAGIKVIMVTGDHPYTALAIAREIGLVESTTPRVVAGEELRRLSATELQLLLDAPEVLFARVGADQKMRIVEALKRKGEIVLVTGDGVNDAPALKSAHIGVAMGRIGTDVARAAADVVLLDDNFASIVNGVEEGRAVFDNIRKFLTYILTHNVAELLPYLAFVLFGVPLALTPIQMLAIDMGTDSMTALGLGSEPPDPAVMCRRPRPQGEPLLNWPLALRAYLLLGPIEAGAALWVFFQLLHQFGWRHGSTLAMTDPRYLQATTACLATIVVVQTANAFLCRSPYRSVLVTGWRGNRLLVAGALFGFVVVLPIVYTPLGNALFGTAPLPLSAWVTASPFVLALVLADEGGKWWRRRLQQSRLPVPGAPKTLPDKPGAAPR